MCRLAQDQTVKYCQCMESLQVISLRIEIRFRKEGIVCNPLASCYRFNCAPLLHSLQWHGDVSKQHVFPNASTFQFHRGWKHKNSETDDNDEISAKAADAMGGSAGLPVGVQVVGVQWRDELVLGAMQVLETALAKRRRGPPAPPPAVPVPNLAWPFAPNRRKKGAAGAASRAPAASSPSASGSTPTRRRVARSPQRKSK